VNAYLAECSNRTPPPTPRFVMFRNLAAILIVVFANGLSAAERPVASLPERVEFNRDIRPILSDNCYFCHGPDKNKREADLRLDTEGGLATKLDAGSVVDAGKPDSSVLVHRIVAADESERMPPVESGKKLSERDIALLKRWIEQGAKWEGHWAFEPVKRHAPPETKEPRAEGQEPFSRNEIDAFVLEGLRQHGLAPSVEADRRTLIRRLSLDLIGLPPTPEEVEAFVADKDALAYEKLVDRLLNSPHFGERLAMWWLDLVRYADSVGYHGDQAVSVYPYREYVIKAFNENKRFDEFTIEQLAGDLLPDATLEQQVAAGYNRLGMMSAEGGVQPKEYLAKYIAERVRNASGTWMGTTLGCAECHDHKFDPFTAKDFYRFQAFFADIKEQGLYNGAHETGEWGTTIRVPTAEQKAELARLDAKLAELRKTLDTSTAELDAAQQTWERDFKPTEWHVLRPGKLESMAGAKLTLGDDGAILVSGEHAAKDMYTLTLENPPEGVTGIKLEVLPDDSLPSKGPGRASNGNFVLSEFIVTQYEAGESQNIVFSSATATFAQDGFGNRQPDGSYSIGGVIDQNVEGRNQGWAVMPKFAQAHEAVFETKDTIAGGEGRTLTLKLVQNFEPAKQHTIGRFRLSVTSVARPIRAGGGVPAEIATILVAANDARSAEQRATLAKFYRSIAPSLDPVRAELKATEAARLTVEKQMPVTLSTVAVEPRMVRVLARGNWMDDSGEAVTPGVPAFLPQPPAKEGRLTRLDLAKWLVARENPLTARVFVNRLWKLYFGAGLSRKLDDIGAQGEWPTHPELLDWLASEFVDSGWDIKRTVKLIVMSGAYRQSSAASAELRDVDPYNHYLARQSRFRLDAELVRDNALAISGLLVTKLGGPSVRPYQPPGYWAYLNFPQREWQNGSGDELYRRGVYVHWQRQYLHPALLAFDAPSREECSADRPRSNTPLQSLVLLNDPSYVEAARALAEEMMRREGDAGSRLDWAFRRATGRSMTQQEATILLALYDKHAKEYHEDVEGAKKLVALGAKPAPKDLEVIELAAWTSVARVILNLHETITRM
jgi:mono/diheme cytochrome c family protein